MSKAWAKGSTRQWRAVRATVLLRDGYRCQLHIPQVCTGIADQVHHLLPRDIAGDDPKYLVASCKGCNIKAGRPGSGPPKRISSW